MKQGKDIRDGKGRFAKGCAKSGGRKKGTPNRAKGIAQRLLEDYVKGNRERVLADINSLNTKDRSRLIMALAKAKLVVYVFTGKEAVKPQRSGRKGGVE